MCVCVSCKMRDFRGVGGAVSNAEDSLFKTHMWTVR